MQFDHFGLVVKDTHETMTMFSQFFGFAIEEFQSFPDQGFQSTMLKKGSVRIELIEALGEDGIIQRFIQKKGYGLHHVSFRVDDLEEEVSALGEKGAGFINDVPAVITDFSKICFVHPASTAGVLLELIHRRLPEK